jgi:hypothetical protein
VSVWRRKALETFPELQRALKDRDEVWSADALWMMYLCPLVLEAHARDDRDLLRRIYGYAAWSSRQPAKEVWNAVGVSFYEHLFDDPQSDDWIERIAEWLPDDVVRRHWQLWESGPHHLSEADLTRLRKHVGRTVGG